MAQQKRPGQKIKLLSVDELLGVPNEEASTEILIEEIVPFKDHPFKVIDDEKMDDLVNSIRHNGILTPVLVRPIEENRYEMISGHRRMHAAQLAGLIAIPAFIRELSDDDATIAMVDMNLQREEILPSEKAFAYKMKYDAVRRRVGRPGKDGKMQTARNLTAAQKKLSQDGTIFRTDQEIADQLGESRNQLYRYMRLTELIPELLTLVDLKKMPLVTGVDISHIPADIQKYLYEYIRENGMVKSYQVTALRRYLDEEGTISQAQMIRLLNNNLPGKTQTRKVTLSEEKLKQYFSSSYSPADMEKIIMRLLERWKSEQGGE